MADDINGSSVAMTAGRNVARALATVLVTLAALVVGFSANAMAAAPAVTIGQPLTGSSIDSQTPVFSGASNDTLDPITLNIYAGTSVVEPPIQTLTDLSPVETSPGEATWEITPEVALEPGEYTAVAEQDNTEAEVGASPPVTFTIDVTRPAVSMNAVASPTEDPRPVLSGGAGVEAGDEAALLVAIYPGTQASGTPVAHEQVPVNEGTWTYAAPLLADGTYTAQAYQRDEAGNVGESAAETFTVETKPPVVTMHTLAAIVNNPKPSLTGTGGLAVSDEADVTVSIHEGTSVAGNVVASENVQLINGDWSYTPITALSDGTYTAQASQSNESHEVGTSGAETFTVDTVPPAVTIATPVNETVLSVARPKFSGQAGTAFGDDDLVRLKIIPAAGPTKELTLTPNSTTGEWSTGSTGPVLANGFYTAVIEQSDDAGNVGKRTATFTVETKPPVVTMNTPAAITNNPKPSLIGTGGMFAGDEADVTVAIHKGTSVSGNVVASENVQLINGDWSYTPTTALPDGTYTAQASQSNERHEVGMSGAETFTVDTVPPAVTIATPVNETVLSVSQPKFSGQTGTAFGDDDLVTLKIIPQAGAPQELTLTPNSTTGEWSTGSTGPVLANGFYTAVIEQLDDAGNVGKGTVTFVVKTNSPSVTLDKAGFVTRGGQLVTGASPSFSGTGSTEPGDSEAVVVNVYSGATTAGSPAQTVEGTLTGSAWTSDQVRALPDGTYTAQAEQADANPGSQAGVSQPVAFTVDADAPQLTVTSPANGSTSTDETQVVSGTAGTQEGDLPGVTVQLYAGSTATGTPLQSLTVQASGANWSATFGGLVPGTYTARAEQSDDVGNVGSSEPVTFTVTVAETAPVTTPSAPSASFKWIPAAPLTGESVTLVSTSTDSSSPIASYAWAPSGNGVLAPGEATLTTTFIAPGPHVVQLRVTDAAGQSSVVAETIPVSAAPVPLMQPFPVVRMAGSYSSNGAKISVLSVLAPVGSKVAITCRGRHCPVKSLAFTATAGAKNKSGTVLITFRRFERSLRAGTIIEIWVSKPGEIGKFTRFTIHRGKSPSRADECLNPEGTTPLVCPS